MTKGCPPISVYTPENLERGLKLASINFCSDIELNEETSDVYLSKIFLWYLNDFVQDINENKEEKLLRFILNYINENKKKNTLEALIESGSFKLNFKDYNWMINKL
jgi:NADPH-dependent 7-cyano-7-deazaguanine reductase QueF-like protein